MTREEIKKHYLEIDKLFTTEFSISKYPILTFKDNKYYLTEMFIIKPKWKELSKELSRFEVYINNVFDEFNIVEILTDVDDTMVPFGNEFIPNMNKLKEKYNTTEILMDGYHGFRTETVENPIPCEYEVP